MVYMLINLIHHFYDIDQFNSSARRISCAAQGLGRRHCNRLRRRITHIIVPGHGNHITGLSTF